MNKVYLDFSDLTAKTKGFVNKFLDSEMNGIERGYMSQEYKDMISALSELDLNSLNLPAGAL